MKLLLSKFNFYFCKQKVMGAWLRLKNDTIKMCTALKKATATGLGSVFGLILSSLVSLITNNNNAYALGFLMFIMLLVFIYYIKYVSKEKKDRSSSADFKELIKRDGVRALFNSTIFLYATVEILLSTKGILSLWSNSYYESLSDGLKKSVIIYNPEVNILLTIAMTTFFYITINTTINYINIDCEQK